MGKKYIIELKDNTAWLQWVNVAEDGTVCFDYKYPEDLTPYTEPDLEQVRKEAYHQGLSDAWECARKITRYWIRDGRTSEAKEIFGTDDIIAIFQSLSASEAIEKIRQYEQKQEEQDGLRQNIQTIVDQCGYTLDEIAEVLQEMKETDNVIN